MSKTTPTTAQPAALSSVTALKDWKVPKDLPLSTPGSPRGELTTARDANTPSMDNFSADTLSGAKQSHRLKPIAAQAEACRNNTNKDVHSMEMLTPSARSSAEHAPIHDLQTYFAQVTAKKTELVLQKFMQAMRNSRPLGWICDLPYQAIRLQAVNRRNLEAGAPENSLAPNSHTPDAPAQRMPTATSAAQSTEHNNSEGETVSPPYVQVLLRADTGNSQAPWLALGAKQDRKAMRTLLMSGWAKQLSIVIYIDSDVLEYHNPAAAAMVLAFDVGTRIAPYWTLLEKALIRHRLTPDEAKALMAHWYKPDKTRLENRQLHMGYLNRWWGRWSHHARHTSPPQFRELVALMEKTQYQGADQAYLWQQYCEYMGGFDPVNGKLIQDDAQRQLQTAFYTAYEEYAKGNRGSFPYVAKYQVYRNIVLGAVIAGALSAITFARWPELSAFAGALWQWGLSL
ncbi:hypothetical protein OE749_01245 [Aestuariibacter sp. AA17]|uniref:Uncharacterized protein n=1 Tax=Fluctibacter corallii TaxID=2984329 RepID=A0ABT3A3R0_9ALTE|nr:hypothetical protein [Aestuariibacter sp. AA17]MCV2883320.1 hypothetical protein [Aestuariibacter sp. AA17]